MSVKIKLKGRSEGPDRNGHTPLYSIMLAGCGIFTREGGWFGPGPGTLVEGKLNLLYSLRERETAWIWRGKSAFCGKLDAKVGKYELSPIFDLKKRINSKYETCVRAVKCTYVINGTVKYTCPRTKKTAGSDETLWTDGSYQHLRAK